MADNEISNPPEADAGIPTEIRVRAAVSYLLMAIFMAGVSLGTFLIHVGAGFIALGVTAFIVGLLIGNN